MNVKNYILYIFWTKSLKFIFIFYTGSTFQFGLATFQLLKKYIQLLAPALNKLGVESKGCWARSSKTRVAQSQLLWQYLLFPGPYVPQIEYEGLDYSSTVPSQL